MRSVETTSVNYRKPVCRWYRSGLFNIHHTADDSLDKIDPKRLHQVVAVCSAFTYLAAASDVNFRSLAPTAKQPDPRACILTNWGRMSLFQGERSAERRRGF
jgi:hypothetical protein